MELMESSQGTKVRQIIKTALDEDIGSGDVTTDAVLTGEEKGLARALVKADTVIAGIEVFREVFLVRDPALNVVLLKKDGERAGAGEVVAEVSGKLASILTAERGGPEPLPEDVRDCRLDPAIRGRDKGDEGEDT